MNDGVLLLNQYEQQPAIWAHGNNTKFKDCIKKYVYRDDINKDELIIETVFTE